MGSTRRYAGVAFAERRAARRERLLDTGLELLGSHGRQGTTVRAVCSRARLTPRYFYESFGDLDALVLAVFDQVSSGAAEVVLAAVSGDRDRDARTTARAAITAFVDYVTEDPRRARVMFIEAMGSEPLTRRRFETLRMFAGLIASEAREFYGMPDADEALVQTSALMLAGGLAETLLAWLDGSLDTTREQLIADCTDLFAAAGETAVVMARRRLQ